MIAHEVPDVPRMTWMERFRAFLQPNYLHQRAKANYLKVLFDMQAKRAYYTGANTDRTNAFNWNATSGDANTFLKSDLNIMRHRCRWLVRNNGDAQAVINALQHYVVGKGLHPQSTVATLETERDDMTDEVHVEFKEMTEWNDRAEILWDDWSMDCDIHGSVSSPESFVECQNLAIKKLAEDGEVFCHIVVDKGNNKVPIYLEFLEPENLDVSKTKNGKNTVTMGVETDSVTNRPVAYWFGSPGVSKRYEAKFMIHLFDRERPGQLRGCPMFGPVMNKFFQLDEYVDYELLGCKVAACFSVFIKNAPGVTTSQVDWLPGNNSTTPTDTDGNPMSNLQAGMIGVLPHGADLEVVQPQKPGVTFGMFTEHINRKIASGIRGGLSYEAMTRDTSKSTFAGGRLAQQMDYQMFSARQAWFTRKFCAPVWRAFIEYAILAGKLKEPGSFNAVNWYRHEWIGSGWSVGINPVQEVNAARDRVRAGISTLADETMMATGRDWENNLRLTARIMRRAKRLGLTLTSDGAYSIMNGVDTPADADPENADADPENEGEAAAQAQAAATAST